MQSNAPFRGLAILGLGLLLLTTIGAAAPRPSPKGAQVYVATDGRDFFDGTMRRPWATIQHAATAVKPGATVHVAPGTYYGVIRTEVGGEANARIRFVSDKRWGAKIVGRSDEAIWLNTGNFVDIEGFEVTGRGYIGIENDASFVKIIGNHVHHLETQCGSNGGAGIDNASYRATDNDVIGNVVDHIASPPGCATPHGQGIYQSNPRGHIWNNITHDNGRCGIHLWHAATNVVISNNLSFSNDFGICLGAGDEPGGVVNDDTVASNNIVVHNRLYGFLENGANGPHNRYVNNIVYENGKGDFKLQNEAAAVGTIQADPRTLFRDWKPDGSGDYHLKPGSPAIARGISTAAPPQDHDGLPRSANTPCDIGPFVARQ